MFNQFYIAAKTFMTGVIGASEPVIDSHSAKNWRFGEKKTYRDRFKYGKYMPHQGAQECARRSQQ